MYNRFALSLDGMSNIEEKYRSFRENFVQSQNLCLDTKTTGMCYLSV